MLNKSYVRRNHRRVSLFILQCIQRKKRNETAKASFSGGERDRDNKKGRRKSRKRMWTPSEQSRISLRITREKTSRWQWAGKTKKKRKRQDKHKTTRANVYPSQDVSQPPEPASTCNRCSTAIGLYFTKSNFSACSYFVVIFFYVFAPIFVFNSGSFYFGKSFVHFVTFDISMTSPAAILQRSPHSVFGSREER